MQLPTRESAAARYKPKAIKLLIIAEAPPCDPERYFYFEHVDRHDWLFRYVWEGLMGTKPDREKKATHLASLRDAGVFVTELHEASIESPSAADLRPMVPDLVARCHAMKPRHVVLIKSVVYDVAFDTLVSAGIPVIDQRIPFPASGQQQKFLDGFRAAAKIAGLGAAR
jgi:hypothetical protein